MRGQSVYVAAKSGLEALTRAIAVEYAKWNIHVLLLRLGPVNTELLKPVFAKLKEDGEVCKAPLREAFGRWDNLKRVLIAFFGIMCAQG